MIFTKNIVFYFLFTIISFFFFNVQNINSIDDYALTYSVKDKYVEDYHKITFYNLNILELDNIIKELNIKIISVKPKENNYYKDSLSYTNTEKLINDYTNILIYNQKDEESISVKINGFQIENIVVVCTIEKLMKLKSLVDIV